MVQSTTILPFWRFNNNNENCYPLNFDDEISYPASWSVLPDASNAVIKLRNGVAMPLLGLGTTHSGGYNHESVVYALRDCGYRLIDTARRYGVESKLGIAIEDSGIPRSEIFLNTKLWPSDYGTNVSKAFESACERLNVTYLDSYMLHAPIVPDEYGSSKSVISETWRQLELLYDAEKVRAIGVSNFEISDIEALLEDCSVAPHLNQCEFHPCQNPLELRELCSENGITFTGYCPLAKGRILNLPTIQNIASNHGKTPAQVCIRWSIQNGICTIPKSRKPCRVRENADVFDFSLTLDEMRQLDELHFTQSIKIVNTICFSLSRLKAISPLPSAAMLLRRRWFFVALLSVYFLCVVSNDQESFIRARRNTKNGCEDIEEILDDGKAAIKFPRRFHHTFTRPWMRTDITTKVYTSKAFTYNWNWFKELKIRGLSTTVNDWLGFLEKSQCLPMIYGEAVRGMLLGSVKDQSALKLEVETTCDIATVYKLCVKQYGSHRCGTAPTRPFHRVTFGQMADNDRFAFSMVDPIVVSAWNTTFNRPKTEWEFTANSLGLYDNTVGKAFIIDLSGRSVSDVCRHIIALPVDSHQRDNWTNDNLVKVLRYFNLKADLFNAQDGVRNFVHRNIRKLFDRLKFQEYYCRFVYDGIFVVPNDDKLEVPDAPEPVPVPECRVVSPDSRSARLIGIINSTMEKDFGDYWNNTMISALSGINYVNLEDHVYLEGAPTQATWPVYDYEIVKTTTTTIATTTTEEYPGDSKYHHQSDEEFVANEFVNVPSEEYSPYSDPSGAASISLATVLCTLFATTVPVILNN
uniref:Aldo_ket_red domain-containing protein n=1 Tax=Panagrellus redivivus TaxID=6233 RepID=A0A7E4VD63_PANRE